MERLFRIGACLLFFAAGCYSIAVSVLAPFHNWDEIPYIASAKAFEQPDAARLQQFAYAELQRVLSPSQYEDLARTNDVGPGRGGPYRHAASTNPEAFAEILPSYGIRAGFNGIVYLLYKAGVDISFATHIVPAAALAASFFFLYLIARRRLMSWQSFLLPLFAAVFGAFELARFSTPDGVAFLALIVCAWLYVNKYLTTLLVFLPLILLVRTDLVLFTVPFYIPLFIQNRAHWRLIAASVATTIVGHFAILGYWNCPSWKTIFACSLITPYRCVHQITQPQGLTFGEYAAAELAGLRDLFADGAFLLYAALLAAAVFLLLRKYARKAPLAAVVTDPAATLLITCLVYVGARFLVYPAEWQRPYPAPYLLTAFCTLWLWSERDRPALSPAPA